MSREPSSPEVFSNPFRGYRAFTSVLLASSLLHPSASRHSIYLQILRCHLESFIESKCLAAQFDRSDVREGYRRLLWKYKWSNVPNMLSAAEGVLQRQRQHDFVTLRHSLGRKVRVTFCTQAFKIERKEMPFV